MEVAKKKKYGIFMLLGEQAVKQGSNREKGHHANRGQSVSGASEVRIYWVQVLTNNGAVFPTFGFHGDFCLSFFTYQAKILQNRPDIRSIAPNPGNRLENTHLWRRGGLSQKLRICKKDIALIDILCVCSPLLSVVRAGARSSFEGSRRFFLIAGAAHHSDMS